jgi:Uma2 family endonuclease
MADNTLQYEYIITIQVGLDALLPNDFVAGDLLWYPVQGRPDISIAPDVLVALGRPKGYRGSYKQWEEGFTPPQVAFEILSPSNTAKEMAGKRWFYEHYGVEEYCEYDPDRGKLQVWVRAGSELIKQHFDDEWRSPRLGITLQLERDGKLSVYGPNGQRFERPIETIARAVAAEARAAEAQARAERLAAKLRELGIEPE